MNQTLLGSPNDNTSENYVFIDDVVSKFALENTIISLHKEEIVEFINILLRMYDITIHDIKAASQSIDVTNEELRKKLSSVETFICSSFRFNKPFEIEAYAIFRSLFTSESNKKFTILDTRDKYISGETIRTIERALKYRLNGQHSSFDLEIKKCIDLFAYINSLSLNNDEVDDPYEETILKKFLERLKIDFPELTEVLKDVRLGDRVTLKASLNKILSGEIANFHHTAFEVTKDEIEKLPDSRLRTFTIPYNQYLKWRHEGILTLAKNKDNTVES